MTDNAPTAAPVDRLVGQHVPPDDTGDIEGWRRAMDEGLPPHECRWRFDGFKNISGLDQREWMAEVECELITQRSLAADCARARLFERGYFNGEIATEIHDEGGGSVRVTAVLTCFGLPLVKEIGSDGKDSAGAAEPA